MPSRLQGTMFVRQQPTFMTALMVLTRPVEGEVHSHPALCRLWQVCGHVSAMPKTVHSLVGVALLDARKHLHVFLGGAGTGDWLWLV